MPTRKRSGVNIQIREGEKNPYIQIGTSLAGIFLVIVLFVLLFAENQAGILVPIAWTFAFLGAALGFFESKKK